MYGYESCWDMFSVIRHFMREPNTLKPKAGNIFEAEEMGHASAKNFVSCMRSDSATTYVSGGS
jgi:hypothetical protein